MNFTRLCSLLRYLYAPENLTGAGVENPHQFDHQPAAIARAWQALVEREKAGIVLADEVGLGKTFEALGVMYFYLLHRLCRERRDEFRALIVLPPRLILKWTDELERFAKQVQQLEPQLSEKERPTARAIERDLPIAR